MLWQIQFGNMSALSKKERCFSIAMKLKFIPLLITILFLFLQPAFAFTNQQWKKISASFFNVYYQNNDMRNSQKILNSLQSSYLQLSKEIGVELIDTVSVFITPSKNAFEQIVGKNFPKWSDGLAAPIKNVIVLKSARWMPPETDNESIAVHELTHIILNRAANGNAIPRWLNEGLAVYYSGEKGFASGSLVSKALVTNSIIPLSEIDEVLRFHVTKAQLAYQQSYLAVDYLFHNYGSEAVRSIIHKLGQGLSVNQAFIDAINADLWQFEDEWYEYIQRKFRWHFLMEFENFLWVFILLLFIFGFLLIRRRNKRIIQQWQEEDDPADLW